MKIKTLLVVACSILLMRESKAVDLVYSAGHGGIHNFVDIGIVMKPVYPATTLTLNDCIVITGYGTNSPIVYEEIMNGCRVYKWNQTSQTWGSSSQWDDVLGSWYPNLEVTAGDAVRVYYYNQDSTNCLHDGHANDHGSCRKIWQTGTPYTDSKSITLKPGWNLVANGGSYSGIINYFGMMGIPFADGDRIGYAGYPAGDQSELACFPSIYWERDSNNGWWVESANAWYCANPQDPDCDPIVGYGDAFWYYRTAGSNYNWTSQFENP